MVTIFCAATSEPHSVLDFDLSIATTHVAGSGRVTVVIFIVTHGNIVTHKNEESQWDEFPLAS